MTPRNAMAAAIGRNDDWERIAVCLLLALARAARNAPPGTIDDVLALLDAEGSSDRGCDERN